MLSALDITTFAQRQFEACFRMAHFFQNDTQSQSETRFRMARFCTAQKTYAQTYFTLLQVEPTYASFLYEDRSDITGNVEAST